MKNLFKVSLWLFNPFIALIYALRKFARIQEFPWFLMSFYFGISFVVSFTGADSERYAMKLIEFSQNPISFVDLLLKFYADEGGYIDIYQQLVTWMVAIFTDNPKFLFGIFAVVFGYFWYKSIEIIIKSSNVENIKSNFLWLVIFMILMTNPIWHINGARMWTAVQIFMYGILCIEVKNYKKGYFWIFSTLLVHISLGSILIWYLIYKLLPLKKSNILFYAYLITFFFGQLEIQTLEVLFNKLPGFLSGKKSYIKEEYIEEIDTINQNASLLYKFASQLGKYIILLIIIYVYQKSFLKDKINNVLFLKVFNLSLFMSIFANLAASFPSGGRFLLLTNMLVLVSFVYFLTLNKATIGIAFKNMVSIALIFLIGFEVRIGLEFIGIFYFIGNPIVMLFCEDNTPFIDFVKSIF